MDPIKAAKMKADGHIAANIGKHYELNFDASTIQRKNFLCWKCSGPTRPIDFQDYQLIEGIQYKMAGGYKCLSTECGHDCITRS